MRTLTPVLGDPFTALDDAFGGGSAGPPTSLIAMNLMSVTAPTIYSFTVTADNVTVAMNLVTSTQTIYQPQTIAAGAVVMNLVTSTQTIYDTTVLPPTATLGMNLVSSSQTLYNTTVTQQSIGSSALLETGDVLLLESGDKLLLESGTDTKVSALSAVTITDDDVFYIVDAPGGTPASKKITAANLAIYLRTT